MSIPLYRAQLPTAKEILPYLEQIDRNHFYSNMGPLSQILERRLADHFGVAHDRISLSANGTLALYQTLKSLNIASGSICLMPSWTFVATAAAAVMAGLTPFFIDIDRDSWTINPKNLFPIINSHKVGCVIAVSPFGYPLNYDAWKDFRAQTGVPVIFDAAAGFDSFSALNRTQEISIPTIVSFHATKVLGIGEGAVVVSNDSNIAQKIVQAGNFGFSGSRNAVTCGINAKLSEYAAAVGLASLDSWPEKRRNWQKLAKTFLAEIQKYSKIYAPIEFGGGWVSSYCHVVVKKDIIADIKNRFTKEKIESRLWWGEGCHKQDAYKGYQRLNLANTEYLSENVMALPFWLGLDRASIDRVFSCFDLAR